MLHSVIVVVNKIKLNCVKVFKYLYLLIFYNTNFIINCVYLGFYVLPLLIILEVNNSLTLNIILNTICAILFTSYIYLFTYQINDLIDEQVDIKNSTYKNSFMSNHRKTLYLQKTVYVILVLLIIIFSFYDLNKEFVLPFILFFILISILHSNVAFLKPITVFLERLGQILLLLYFLSYSYFPTLVYVLLFCYPIITHSRYILYLSYKRSFNKVTQKRTFVIVYTIYYIILSLVFLNLKIESILYYIYLYLLMFLILSFIIYLLKKTNIFKSMLDSYNSVPNQRKDLLIMILLLFIYTLHFII